MNHDPDNSHEDFGPLEHELRSQRPSPTDAELNRIRHRATSAGRADQRSRRGIFSPARLAMVSLVSGLLLVGGSGASLAVSGLSADGSAGIAQYIQTPSTVTTPTDTGAVLPSQDQGGTEPGCPTSAARASQTNCPEDETGTAPSLDQGDTEPAAETGSENPAQETRQVSEGGSDGRLPFTGLLALPLMLIGVLMLGAGFVLRRTSAQKLG